MPGLEFRMVYCLSACHHQNHFVLARRSATSRSQVLSSYLFAATALSFLAILFGGIYQSCCVVAVLYQLGIVK